MDHEGVLEALDLAAAEPGGLERLMAGDTATAMAVAAHLVGCPSCALELDRLRHVSGLVRDVMVTALPPSLRQRTLSHVREHGVRRGVAVPGVQPEPASAATLAADAVTADAGSGTRPTTPIAVADRRPSTRRIALGWVAAVAAAVALSVATTTFIVEGRLNDRLSAQDDAIGDLAAVTTATLHLTAEPDVARVSLDSPATAGVTGTLIYSPSSTDLVVVATGLTEPAAGMQYRCWVDLGAGRESVGRMFFGGGLAYWVGPSAAVKGSTGKVTFGVSLVGADGKPVGPDPVLVGAS